MTIPQKSPYPQSSTDNTRARSKTTLGSPEKKRKVPRVVHCQHSSLNTACCCADHHLELCDSCILPAAMSVYKTVFLLLFYNNRHFPFSWANHVNHALPVRNDELHKEPRSDRVNGWVTWFLSSKCLHMPARRLQFLSRWCQNTPFELDDDKC